MFTIIRASRALMPIVCEIINSNIQQIQTIMAQSDNFMDYLVDADWVKFNYPRREFYLARVQKQYIGMASFQVLKDFAYIGYFHIRAHHHRQGYGKKLMEFLEFYAKKDGLTTIRLFTHKKAKWAIDFYTNLSFKLIETNGKKIKQMHNGIFKPFHSKDHILWQKVISSQKSEYSINDIHSY